MEDVKNWLESEHKDFQEGLALLEKYSRNRMLANALARKQNAANAEKLSYELSKLAGAPMRVAAPKVERPGKTPATEDPKKTVSESTEKLLDELVAEMQKLFNDAAQLSNTLADQKTDEDRERLASEILAKKDAYNKLAERKQYFEDHGKFPDAPAVATDPASLTDKAELLKVRGNLRSQVSKAKAAAEKKPGDVAKQEKLAKLQVELNNVEMKIKLLG